MQGMGVVVVGPVVVVVRGPGLVKVVVPIGGTVVIVPTVINE